MNRFARLASPCAMALALGFGSVSAHGALVAHWSLDANASDTTGSHNGTVVGATVTFGQPGARVTTGTSANFTGTGHIDVAHSPALNPSSFTATLWANPTIAGGGSFRSPLTSRDDAAGSTQTYGYIIYNNSSGQWDFWTGDGDAGWDALPGPAVAINTWTHLAVAFDAGTNTKTLYVNGAATQTVLQQYVPNGPETEDLHIGAGADPGNQFNFEGRIDDVGLFNTALSAAQINTIRSVGVSNFNAGITPVVITPTAVTESPATTDPANGALINIINGSGLNTTPTIDNILTVTHAGGNSTNQWVTLANVPDYYTARPAPVLTFNLGGDFDVTDIVFWNYGIAGNAAKDFLVEYSLNGSPFFASVGGVIPQATGTAHLFDLGTSLRADMIRITFTDNYFGQGAGGDRVGLHEIRFIGSAVILPEPATAGLALLGVLALSRRRRIA